MKKYYILLGCTVLSLLASNAFAQCPAGQTQVTIEVHTDYYGEEGYWELVPSGNACGVGTIVSGGNAAQVGCAGGGAPYTATPGSGYAGNTTITIPAACYNNGNTYSIKYIDDFGDGGYDFTVKMNGFPVYQFTGASANNTFNFTVAPPPLFDMGVKSIEMPVYGQAVATNVRGEIFNYGSTTITSFTLNYSINGGTPVSQVISGVNITGYTGYNFTHPTPWTPSGNGNYTIDVWATNLNGSNPDPNSANDHKTFVYAVGPATPNKINDYLSSTHTFTTIATAANGIQKPRDLDFHPVLTRNELWVILKETEASGGKTAKISNAGLSNQSVLIQQDGNAWHFMSLPTGIAFSDNGNFCTSPGVLDANHAGGKFTGPALWSSDPAIYAQPSGGNGSHLDMLHECPYAMGVAWEKDNVFWVFDSYYGDIMRNDFAKDHGPGNDDHTDGKVRGYADFTVARINLDIPCHLALDDAKKWLYIVDGGNNKIRRMDITTGQQTGTFTPMEPIAESSIYTGTTWSDYITTGLVQPSGVDIIGNRLIISDYSNGDIVIYDCSTNTAMELGRIHTGQQGIQGVKIGPDGKIWYVNYTTNEVKRIDYTLWPAGISGITAPVVNVSPNPGKGLYHIELSTTEEADILVSDIYGKTVGQYTKAKGSRSYTLDLTSHAAGTYLMTVSVNNTVSHHKLVLSH